MTMLAGLSRYHPRYVRSVVYMLQSSEYMPTDFFRWYFRVEDFTRVERRKHLVKTKKALVLLAAGWVVQLAWCAAIVRVALFGAGASRYALAFLMALAMPYVVACGLMALVVAGHACVRKPMERMALWRTQKRLARHGALRIAIAGSFGKTTMREILKTVLAQDKRVAAPPHSHNTIAGIARFVQKLRGDEDVLIFELVEYYPGDVRRLCAMMRPHIGIITGVNEAHLQKFKNLERTRKTIFELADYIGEGPLYINGESAMAGAHAAKSHKVYTREGVSDWRVRSANADLGGTQCTFMHADNTEIAVRTRLLGLHHVGSLAAAADIASDLGMSHEQIRQGIANIRPFSHRLEAKTDASGVTILDDSYNGNPDGVRVIIEFLASLKGRRRFYVTPGLVEMGEKTKTVHREIGASLAGAGIEHVVLIKNSATPYIAQGLADAGYAGKVAWFDDAASAYASLPHLTVEGDVVVLQNDWPDQYA